MSRIGKAQILIPSGVTVTLTGDNVLVKGQRGELFLTLRPEIAVKMEGQTLDVFLKKTTKDSSAHWGTARANIANMIKGVTDGFQKKLELSGVGFRASGGGNKISMTLGFSHPVEFEAPKGINLAVEEQKFITVSGFDKALVGLTSAKIKALRKPEPYKGKGVKYAGEVLKLKPGKAGKAK